MLYTNANGFRNKWSIMERRRDKTSPNSLFTVTKTIQSIDDNITMQKMCDIISPK